MIDKESVRKREAARSKILADANRKRAVTNTNKYPSDQSVDIF